MGGAIGQPGSGGMNYVLPGPGNTTAAAGSAATEVPPNNNDPYMSGACASGDVYMGHTGGGCVALLY
jgi:hypothetical protein